MKSSISTLIAATALATVLAHGAIVPDSDTILYVSCDTDWGFGVNLATASDKLTSLYRKDDRLAMENPVGAFIRDGVSGEATSNGGYLYSANGPAVAWQSNGYTSGDFTFEVFIRADADATLYYLANHTGGAWRLQWNGSKQLVLRKNWDALGTSPALNDGAWHHIAVVQDKTAGMISYYVDYTLISRSNVTTELDSSSDQLIIGAYTRNGEYNFNNQSTKCAYDEVRLVKCALSPREFLFTRAYPVDADTIAYMSFDSSTEAKYDIDLGQNAPSVTRRSKGSAAFGTQSADVAAATLFPGARAANGYSDGGAATNSLGESGDNGSSGFGYSFSDSNHLIGPGSFTVETFAKFTVPPSPWYGYVFFQNGVWNVFLNANGILGCNVRGTNHVGAGNVSDGAWHHLAAVYDASRETISFYLDYALYNRVEGIALADAENPGTFLFGGSNTENTNWSIIGGANGALYDELRITKRALKPTEFLTTTRITNIDPVFFARFEHDFEGMAAGRYAVTGEVSAAGAELAASARASREILNASREVLFGNTNGIALSGGTVAYPGNGIFDLDAAMSEFFVRAEAGDATAPAISFAADGSANPIWRLSASGAFVFNTTGGSLSTNLGIGDHQFHHLAVAYAPSGANTAVTVYLDHETVASRTLAGTVDFGSGAGFLLGSAGFSGAIDELRIREGVIGTEGMLYAAPPSATVILMK